MKFKSSVIFLLSIIGALVLLYAGSFIFSSERTYRRSAYFTWLDKKSSLDVDRIAVKTSEQEIEFINNNRGWFIIYNGIEYPARELRIQDFIGVFTQRDLWQVRSTSANNLANFGLEAESADRVTMFGRGGTLLDVLIGSGSVYGNETYIRKFANNEVRSGDNRIRTYLSSPVQSWYNLKLFSETEGLQRLTVLKDDGETQYFSLSNKMWTVSGVTEPDNAIIDSYIRILLSTEGDDFLGLLTNSDEISVSSSITAEFGNGTIETIIFSEPDENGRRTARSDRSNYIYSVPAWQSSRIFRDTANFQMQ